MGKVSKALIAVLAATLRATGVAPNETLGYIEETVEER
jgi:hypothetical protein